MRKVPTFGIDLGTTCSTIGWVERGEPKLISIDGDELLPSVVSFPEDQLPMVGRAALHRMELEPDRTIRSAKRFIGEDHRWIVDDRFVSPVEVAALIVQRLAEAAKEATGIAPQQVVITVPAWFNQAQRAETRDAGMLAGLEVVRLINEPTAAALAHAHGQDIKRTALVYDLGGGTFDVSLIDQDGPLVEVRASRGDTRLGGDDIDHGLLQRVLRDLEASAPDFAGAIANSSAAQVRLRQAVERAKIELSNSLSASVRVPFVAAVNGEPEHLAVTLERADLEAVAMPVIERTLDAVTDVLQDADAKAEEVDELLLVGGSSLNPMVWKCLRQRFGLEGSAAIPPREAVGLGAAVQAAIVDGSPVAGVLLDVAPYSLSISAVSRGREDGDRLVCRVITPRNASLPTRHAECFFTSHPLQEVIEINVFQGSDSNPLANSVLARVEMTDLPPAPPGEECRPIEVEFLHNLDGMVEMRVTDKLSGSSVNARVAADGQEVKLLRAELERDIQARGLIAGDGEASCRVHPSEGGAAPARRGTELDEARQTFAALEGKSETLLTEHPTHALNLLELAREGARHLKAGRRKIALEIYDRLSDRLFEIGIYL